jgi:RNA polymerase sigma factor (sigma-70 family)
MTGLTVAEAGHHSDADGFAEWVAPQLSAMANLAARMVGPADRDDVVQESLTRAWRRWETFDPSRGTPRSWLLAIVADRARRHNRRHFRPAFTPAPYQTQIAGDTDVLAVVARLSRRQRMAVELHYLLDLPVAEVAEVMGCSEGTVKSTLHDARTRLRQLLEER